MDKVIRIKLCDECGHHGDSCGHNSLHVGYLCGICLEEAPDHGSALRCCSSLLDNFVMPPSAFTKEKKKAKVRSIVPVNATKGRRDK